MLSSNLRNSLYEEIVTRYETYEVDTVNLFCQDTKLDYNVISNFITAKNSYLSTKELNELFMILQPPLELKNRWISMYGENCFQKEQTELYNNFFYLTKKRKKTPFVIVQRTTIKCSQLMKLLYFADNTNKLPIDVLNELSIELCVSIKDLVFTNAKDILIIQTVSKKQYHFCKLFNFLNYPI